MKPYLIYTFLICILVTRIAGFAQEPVRLDEAIQIAIKNNGRLQTEAKSIEYRKTLLNSALIVSPTKFNGEFGQFNSAYFDTGFGVSQNFEWPSVYKNRKLAYSQSVKSSEAGFKITETALKQQLHELFDEFRYLRATEQLLLYQDSLFDGFLQKATLRWQQGETDPLEKTTAEQQKINISGKLASVSSMKEFILLDIDRLLNDGRHFIPVTDSFDILPLNMITDNKQIEHHPAVLAAALEIESAKTTTRLEKSALLPQFNIGYRNVGIRGTGADNIVYGIADRFSSFQIGMDIPVFRKGYQSAVKAARIQEEVKSIAYETLKTEIETRIRQQYLLYQQTLSQINQYKGQSLPNAKVIRSVTEKKFSGGEINYLELVLLTNQAIQIETDYLALIRKVNNCIINLHFLNRPE